MLQFHPNAPFPITAPGRHTKTEIAAHSSSVDEWLGMRVSAVETKLDREGCRMPPPNSSGEMQRLWFGLDPQELLTPYIELRFVLEKIAPKRGQTVVDLGAAYGRMAFVLARHFPDVDFVGYEYVGERILEARRAFERIDSKRVRLDHSDIAAHDFAPADADFYFIYDYGSDKALMKTLYDLRQIAARRRISIVARGRRSRYLIESQHLWLTNSFPSESLSNASVYGSSPLLLHPLATSVSI
jgi:SAM-dependent methyltransferase